MVGGNKQILPVCGEGDRRDGGEGGVQAGVSHRRTAPSVSPTVCHLPTSAEDFS